jgi:hypothetical protein
VGFSESLSARQSRAFEIVIGIAASLIGGTLLLFAAFIVVRTFRHPPRNGLVILLTATLVFATTLLPAGIRLLTGRHRRDGGLFSPWVLRFGGMIFFFSPIAIILNHRALSGLLEISTTLAAGVACFALANRRTEKKF